ncbi:MAG: glutamine--fructose-6-phosphate transaminase (isomerizing) [Elusimicrobiota bacterium]|nr:glutamine--fructose-6-phosphate transaminase (isomerizing) [Elusimicrobiota bacterium]
MCGIIGYIGEKKASDFLIEGLKRLEYRGYDSCGIATINENRLSLRRVSGRVGLLEETIEKKPAFGICGIAHTRWATHGIPSEDNAHPHTDCKGEIVLVHNGIIENYAELKEKLLKAGHKFKSETDTEVVIHLIEDKIKSLIQPFSTYGVENGEYETVFFEAFKKAIADIEGSFALAVIWAKCPDLILSARLHSPLVIGLGKKENFVASDVSAFLKFAKKVVFLEDGEIALVRKNSVNYFNFSGKGIKKKTTNIKWDASMAEKGGYNHFMLKEIHEQAESVENTIRGRLLPLEKDILKKEIGLKAKDIKSLGHVQIVACGTAHHAGLVAKYIFENFEIPTYVDFASEFSDRAKIIDKNTFLIAISQSGETADTLCAVREAKESGAKVLSITNTVGSSLTREADYVLYTHCGPEIGVASTKAFLGQLSAIYVLAIHFAVMLKKISLDEAGKYVKELIKIPRFIEELLGREDEMKRIADKYSKYEHFLFISRYVNFPIALEGALKIKEIAYVHAEGYAAGEMKHGPIAIIEKNMPVICIATNSKVIKLLAGNIEEAMARGARIIAIVDSESKKYIKASETIEVPKTLEMLSPLLNTIPLQIFAYYIALNKKCDIDKPRNLAKSVTVR